jgi:HEXXH motif-containing protein
LNYFLPSAASGLRSRKAIQARLAESLEHIFSQCASHIQFDRETAAALVERVTNGERVPPALFGAYFQLVETIEDGSLDDVGRALEVVLRHASGPTPAALRVRPLNRTEFTEDEEAGLRRSFVSDSLLDEQIGHLTGEKEEQSRAQFERALSILRQHAPATFAEIETHIGEFIPARGKPAGGMEFDGCSSLERWGSILINASLAKTDLELCEMIAHEASHNALFAMAPLNFHVENDPEERYASPLRVDPRPMNGLYHATFVLARMCYAMREVAASPSAPPALAEEARKLADASATLFAKGYETVRQHAIFTPEGREIMRDAADFMCADELA